MWNLRFASLNSKTELSGKAFDNVKVLLGLISNEVDPLENRGSREINDSIGKSLSSEPFFSRKDTVARFFLFVKSYP